MEKICKTCRWFKEFYVDRHSECYYNPPVASYTDMARSTRPFVRSENFCAMWASKSVQKVQEKIGSRGR